MVANAEEKGGYVYVVGTEPVLVGVRKPDHSIQLLGQPGLCVTLQFTTNLYHAAWQSLGRYTLAERSQILTLPPPPGPAVFYRALVCDTEGNVLELHLESNHTGTLILSGKAGAHYTVEQINRMTFGSTWSAVTNFTLGNTNAVIRGLSLTNQARFFRATSP